MERKEFILQENDSGRRLDRVLKRLLPNRTAAQIYSALRKGLVKVNGKKAAENYTTQNGDAVSVAEFLLETTGEDAPCPLLTAHCPLQKIFSNENFLLINKPSGISVHGKGSLAQMVASQSKNSSLSFRAGPLHRLDKETTGLLAFSQSLAGAKWFSQNIQSHAIKKYYLGIVCGRLENTQTWNDPIDGKEAVTIASPLAIGEIKGQKITFVEFQILTGRKHQIRIHSAAHGHPLLGDAKHGAKGFPLKRLEVGNGGESLLKNNAFFLHAHKMEFPPNDLGLPPILEAPLPAEFAAFLKEYFPSESK